ncbi:HD domain-containing protein [Paenibacillus thiaminolyticus]|uniref:HD domain-containing protein n=1 Tax=Paenibacillus thiaminolyticus TaxID=49283 RepID=A0AAP9J225_PANTH|nr:HD domain-containing phosphohydrolase [Paenibacillus thiaminolyticus]MCY9535641.1 HD domain-containing protein [Paenibacillus thiaminolyticus]MCY9602210.1 HD domain-containing protein [Paenibacillus thiaminolyticus]MCY9605930.1 HD domain-containing protein [Paenibacillus thiaminolyticus]MCY9612337.1 HD domain-containing protein [Paenibacillus thiaminolyticus]MCY9619332.1 HD domain-containing protein [Paenibacillus thiaminolyticus]
MNVKVHVLSVTDGDIVAKDIFNSHGLLVISAGTRLKEKDIALLLRHHLDFIDIEERQAESMTTLPQLVSSSRTDRLQSSYKEAVAGVEQLFYEAAAQGHIQDEQVEQTLTPLIHQIKEERDVVSLLLMMGAEDDCTYQHSVQVGMLSYYLAKWLNYNEADAVRVGKAGFLHEIGMALVEKDTPSLAAAGIQAGSQAGSQSEEEAEQMKKHTRFGCDLLRGTYDDEWLYLAALQHHERLDGSGYPSGLKEDEIHPVSRIVAIAAVYSEMTSICSGQPKQNLFCVLRDLHAMSFGQLDPTMTHTFIRNMIPNFLHKQARLNDGRTGIIVMSNQTELFRPLVQIDQEFVDLAQRRQLEIEHVYV